MARKNAVFKITLVVAAIGPDVLAFTLLSAFDKVTFVLAVIRRPLFDSITLLTIIDPQTFILIALEVGKLSLAVSHVIFPFSYVTVAIGVDHSTSSVAVPKEPLAFVAGIIRILHDSNPIFYELLSSKGILAFFNRYKFPFLLHDALHLTFVGVAVIVHVPVVVDKHSICDGTPVLLLFLDDFRPVWLVDGEVGLQA